MIFDGWGARRKANEKIAGSLAPSKRCSVSQKKGGALKAGKQLKNQAKIAE
jgi:hypothetical protein